MLASCLANGENLARVVVLKSLFNMNYSSLVQKLGGLLNKRVYYFPCSRDKVFKNKDIEMHLNILKECQKNKGVVITLPEYCLSFKLKGVEFSSNPEKSVQASQLIAVQNWLDTHTRDILDESDEILKVMYQLVYTVGNNTIVNGGDVRWKLAQHVFELAKSHFEILKKEFDNKCIEYNQDANPETPQAFKSFRLLNKDPYKKLCELVVTDILRGKSQIKMLGFKDEEFECLKKFACEDEISVEDRIKLGILFQDAHLKTILLILRGFFAYEILFNVLSKRWRVNFGINPNGNLLQAVPFRAKDMPAERAQFAHADIAIMLTILHYYYAGLSMSQFNQVFCTLENDKEKDHIYDEWMNKMPQSIKIDASIREYSGVNLSDSNQLNNILFPVLHVYPPVINYYLNNFVFPKEAKQFASKTFFII